MLGGDADGGTLSKKGRLWGDQEKAISKFCWSWFLLKVTGVQE